MVGCQPALWEVLHILQLRNVDQGVAGRFGVPCWPRDALLDLLKPVVLSCCAAAGILCI